LTSALDRDEWSASCFSRFTPGTHWREGWVGLRNFLNSLDKREISFLCRESKPDIQHIGHHYTGFMFRTLYSTKCGDRTINSLGDCVEIKVMSFVFSKDVMRTLSDRLYTVRTSSKEWPVV
jgi:hypothetical protein